MRYNRQNNQLKKKKYNKEFNSELRQQDVGKHPNKTKSGCWQLAVCLQTLLGTYPEAMNE